MFQSLFNREIHIWQGSLTHYPRYESLFNLLSEDEQQRALRYISESARRHFVIGRGFLRILLGKYLHIKPKHIIFDYNAHGKPIVANSGLFFNMSHSGDVVLYVFARFSSIGIDVEQHREIDMAGISARFFSEKDRKEPFFDVWVKKEAIIKAKGEGVFCNLKEIREEDWFLYPVDVESGYSAVLASEIEPTNIQRYDIMDILDKLCCL